MLFGTKFCLGSVIGNLMYFSDALGPSIFHLNFDKTQFSGRKWMEKCLFSTCVVSVLDFSLFHTLTWQFISCLRRSINRTNEITKFKVFATATNSQCGKFVKIEIFQTVSLMLSFTLNAGQSQMVKIFLRGWQR